MRILNISVGAFGKLKDFSLQPQAGLNRYLQPNEFGKTTLIYFIYYMLYGYDTKLLKTYLPWSGEDLAGSLDLELQGKTWRITRRRPAGRGMEKRQILCLESGEELILANKEQPGNRFLGLDGETFLRSFCITQGDLLFSRTDGLDVALKNMAATGDENVSYPLAEEYLNKLHTQYKHRTRNAGHLVEQKEALALGKEREQMLRAAAERRLSEREQWQALEEKLAQKEQQIEALRQRRTAAEGSDALKLLQRLDALKNLPRAEKPRLEKAALSALEQAFETAERTQGDLQAAQSALDRAQAEWDRMKEAKGGALPLILLVAGAVAGILAAALAVWSLYLVLGGLWIAAAVLMLTKNTARRAERAGLERNLQADRQAQQQAKELADAAAQTLEQLRQQYRIFTKEEVRDLQIAWGVYESGAGEESIALQEQAILAGKTRAELEVLAVNAVETEETAAQVQELLRREELQREDLRRQKDALDPRELRQAWERLEECAAQNALLEQEISEGEERLLAIQQSLSWLKEANEEMNTRFAPKLCEAAGKYLALLTDGKYRGLMMDDGFSIRLETAEGSFPAEQFSAGTRDAVYFAFRLAASEMLSAEALPMVLDDPFTNLDETRRAAAESLLQKAASNRQILYFSCRI